MKKRYGLSLFGGVLVLAFALSDTKSMACGLAWTTPKGHFDGVDEQGNLSYWEKIGDLDLGKDLKIPLIMGFESSRNLSSPYLGDGWTLALLDSNIVQVDDKRFTMVQPDGLTSRFWRKRATDTTLSGQKGWMAEITGNQITIWAKCGWKMVFTDGKITSMTTPQNQQLTYVYEGGIVNEIDEDGVPVLKVSLDSATGAVSGLSLNGKQIGMTEGQKPRVENINGQNAVGGVKQSLQKLTLADGSVETFKFAVTPKLLPTLAISGVNNRSFSWDPVSRLILQDGDWSYNVVPGQQQRSNPQITRTNKAGQSEYWFNDEHRGQVITQGLDGVKQITQVFTGAKLLKGKVRSVTRIKDGVSIIVCKYDYDETGKMIREILAGRIPHEYTFKYDARGKQIEVDQDGKLFMKKDFDAQGRLICKTFSTGIKKTYLYLANSIEETTYLRNGEARIAHLPDPFASVQQAASALLGKANLSTNSNIDSQKN